MEEETAAYLPRNFVCWKTLRYSIKTKIQVLIISAFRASNVRPYITVSIKDKIFRTSTADGTNPTWNEQLTIPLDAASDQIRKFLNIDLYDEVTEDLLEDDRARTTEVYQRISSKWLGQLRIPIRTIYLNHRVGLTLKNVVGLPLCRRLTN